MPSSRRVYKPLSVHRLRKEQKNKKLAVQIVIGITIVKSWGGGGGGGGEASLLPSPCA